MFDVWLEHGFPGVLFERYADDIICHCRSEQEAARVAQGSGAQVPAVRVGTPCREDEDCLLQGHQPQRELCYPAVRLSGLLFSAKEGEVAKRICTERLSSGSEPQGAQSNSQDGARLGSSDDAATRHSMTWRGCSIRTSAAGSTTTVISTKSALYPTLRRIDEALINWARRKFKRLRQKPKGARDWVTKVAHTSLDSLLTGRFCMVEAQHWEPYESRDSRTVLGERRGAIPRAITCLCIGSPRCTLGKESTLAALPWPDG